MEKTRGTELVMDINDNMNVAYGSVDKNNPKTIYIKFSAWANTIDFDEDLEYKTVIRKLSKEIKRHIYFNLNKDLFNQDMTMVDMDMRESGITDNKSSFMSCEVTLYQVNNFLLDEDVIINELQFLCEHICEEIYCKDLYFEFFKHKRQAKKEITKSLNTKV